MYVPTSNPVLKNTITLEYSRMEALGSTSLWETIKVVIIEAPKSSPILGPVGCFVWANGSTKALESHADPI